MQLAGHRDNGIAGGKVCSYSVDALPINIQQLKHLFTERVRLRPRMLRFQLSIVCIFHQIGADAQNCAHFFIIVIEIGHLIGNIVDLIFRQMIGCVCQGSDLLC